MATAERVLRVDISTVATAPAGGVSWMIGASAALALSGMPLTQIMGAARVGYRAGEFVLNPTQIIYAKEDIIHHGFNQPNDSNASDCQAIA